MKLNYKRTFYVGFAFFLISCLLAGLRYHDPLILTNKFGLSQAWSGVLMALDNVLALFLLPLFGALSDRVHTRLGRRTPFILCGTLVARRPLWGCPLSTGRSFATSRPSLRLTTPRPSPPSTSPRRMRSC